MLGVARTPIATNNDKKGSDCSREETTGKTSHETGRSGKSDLGGGSNRRSFDRDSAAKTAGTDAGQRRSAKGPLIDGLGAPSISFSPYFFSNFFFFVSGTPKSLVAALDR